ncbi:hypothetical protein [Bacillus stercoris]|uniref:hypothetical protein n=1 Tax=Bacillus stercoris TaxID=2054641 RepID=UPI003CE9661E
MDKENIFGMKDVFEFYFFDWNGDQVLHIETTGSSNFRASKSGCILTITDCLVNLEFLNEIMNGKHIGENYRIKGKSLVRDLNGEDLKVELDIKESFIADYFIRNSVDDLANPTLRISFPFKDLIGYDNFSLQVVEEWSI